MWRWAPPLLVLAVGLLAASVALRTPAPRPATAPPGLFSAGRALIDVRQIARKPHPTGSDEQARVQTYLLRRMGELGLAPQAHLFNLPKGLGRNLIGILPGKDRAAPAVLLMAHTDSVAAGPGAADDGAGVAAVLETVRALSSAPRQRDVMVLLTEGEEVGLLGSKAFFAADPMRGRVGVVINLEARGNRGRAMMFETSRDAGSLIQVLITGGALGSASSLMPDLYRRLPNDTDLTQALTHGHAGLNFAFMAGVDAYHRPADTLANLDPGSLQHIGDQVLRAAMVLATAASLPGRAPDQVYADVLGGPVLHYPPWAGWALLAIGIGGAGVHALRQIRSGHVTLPGTAAGAGAVLVLLLMVGATLFGLSWLRLIMSGHHLAPILAHAGELRLGLGATVLGLALIWWTLCAPRLGGPALALGAFAILGAGALTLQALAPLDAFVLAWPLVLIGLALSLHGPGRPWSAWACLSLTEALVLYWTLLLFDLTGQTAPFAVTPFALVAVAAALPICPKEDKWGALAGVAATAVGLCLSVLALYA